MRKAAVMLIIENGRILSISRRYDQTKFGLPGGKLEPNEASEVAAIRETLEETGVKVSKCIHIFRREELSDRPGGEDFITDCYYALEWSGIPQDSEEGKVEWLSEQELIGNKGAFADYNTKTLSTFRKMYPGILE